MSKFTNLYQLSKTLRFELRLSEDLKNMGMSTDKLQQITVEKDRQRNEDFKQLKTIITQYHDSLIERSLNQVKASLTASDDLLPQLEQYKELFFSTGKDKDKDKNDKTKRLQDLLDTAQVIKKTLEDKVNAAIGGELSLLPKKERKTKKTAAKTDDDINTTADNDDDQTPAGGGWIYH